MKSNYSFVNMTQYDRDKAIFEIAIKGRSLRKKTKILVVDDQEFTRELLRGILLKDYAVYTASCGKGALSTYIAEAPDIVFLDIEMPDLSGHEVIQQIVKLDPESYVVMLTASKAVSDVKLAGMEGAKGFICKPFNKQKIFDIIKNYTLIKEKRNKGA